MEIFNDRSALSGAEFWQALQKDLSALLSKEDALVTTLANAAAFLYQHISRINWSGFYLYDGQKLLLGPFCGKPACTVIELSAGVCGTAASTMQTVAVPDVHSFPGHIACDPMSRSEVVVPIRKSDGSLLAVLDIDSPELDRFSEQDIRGIESLAQVIAESAAEPIGIL
jgi:GAF domain-containing protein